MKCRLTFILLTSLVEPLWGQQITELDLYLDPNVEEIRPLDSVVVQVRAYGRAKNDEGEEVRVRLRVGEAAFRILENDAGWLSKPFRFQGEETEPFHDDSGSSFTELIFGTASDRFLRQDSVLYTASETPGTYTVEATSGGMTIRKWLRVDQRAAALRPAERKRFGAEPPIRDRYRSLAEHYAPLIAQATWFDPKADYLARFDFDGDWIGDNNWDSTPFGSSQAYVYYGAVETETHWFLIYSFFHTRDYSDKCVAGTCHENDCEGMILTVLKDGSPSGRIQVMETLAHNNVYSYRFDKRVKKRAHGFDGQIELYEQSHPVLFIESAGHGVYSSADRHSIYSFARDTFSPGTGVTYLFKGRAERPRHPNDRLVGYELIPVYDHWWKRSEATDQPDISMFADFYDYQPYGSRPDTREVLIPGAFVGKQFGTNKAKPFWAWYDRRTSKKELVAPGQWGLDPAYAVSKHLKFPQPFSLVYTSNVYLDTGQREASPGEVERGSGRGSRSWPTDGRSGEFTARQVEAAGRTGAHFFELRLQTDEVLDVRIRGDRISYTAVRGRTPVDMGCTYTVPLPGNRISRLVLKQLAGRGITRLLEEPSVENDFTAALRIEDPRRGSDLYVVRLEWNE